jgi:hypothetical protein
MESKQEKDKKLANDLHLKGHNIVRMFEWMDEKNKMNGSVRS